MILFLLFACSLPESHWIGIQPEYEVSCDEVVCYNAYSVTSWFGYSGSWTDCYWDCVQLDDPPGDSSIVITFRKQGDDSCYIEWDRYVYEEDYCTEF